jgi:acyl-CoA thioester hydrolase
VTDRDAARPPTDPDVYTHWITDTVRFSDQDAIGHINNVAFAAYVESGRVAFGRVMRDSEEADQDFILAHLSIDYLAQGHYPGEVRIGTRLVRIGRSSLTVGHGLFKDGVCIATAEGVLVHLRDGRSTPIPDDLRTRLEGMIVPY